MFGGRGLWLGKEYQNPSCSGCNTPLVCVAQVQTHWGGDEQDNLHRTLFVFGCFSPDCCDAASRWRAFRCAKMVPSTSSQDKICCPEPSCDNEWGTSADDDWAVAGDGFDCSDSADFSWDPSHTSAAFSPTPAFGMQSPDKNVPQDSRDEQFDDDCVQSQCFWESREIDVLPTDNCVLQEMSDQKPTPDFAWEMEFGWEPPKLPKCSAKEIRMAEEYAGREHLPDEDDDVSQGGNHEEEEAEQPSADDVFLKFQRRVARAPSQVVRHHLGGKPLWLTKPHEEAIPPCSCGASRQYELQILPTLIHIMHSRCPQFQASDCDFGSVYVYTCSADCRASNGREVFEEFIVTQDSP